MASKLKDNLKYHITDSTALLAESTPFFAAFEVGLAGMSDEVSLNARVIAAGAIALTAGIYSLTPEQQEGQINVPSIEQVVETN